MRRGKDKSNDSLHQLLQLLAPNGVKEAADCLNQRVHLNHDIVTELCNHVGQTLLRMITEKFHRDRATGKYAILAGEAIYVSVIALMFSCGSITAGIFSM